MSGTCHGRGAYARLVADAVEQGDIAMVSDLNRVEVLLHHGHEGSGPKQSRMKWRRWSARPSRRPLPLLLMPQPLDKLITDGKALARENLSGPGSVRRRARDDVEKTRLTAGRGLSSRGSKSRHAVQHVSTTTVESRRTDGTAADHKKLVTS